MSEIECIDKDLFKFEIECIDKDGNVNFFLYKYEINWINNRNVWNFSIIPKEQSWDDFFYFSATEISNDTMKVTMMDHHNRIIYKAKGIPEKMIEELNKITSKKIISSTNNVNSKILFEEFRTPKATNVWNRLKNNNKATFDIDTDIYTFK
jgi:hypothetical protein